MKTNRRELLKSGGMALLGSGLLKRMDRVAGMQASPEPDSAAQAQSTVNVMSLTEICRERGAKGPSQNKLLGPTPGEEGPPQPATYDRLPLEWNKRQVKIFKDRLAERGVECFLLRDPLNVIYMTGYWHTTTERPQATFMNKNDADPWYLYPAIDRNLVKGWWYGDGAMYFDYKHSEGGFPEQGKLTEGKTVDLFKFMLEGIKKHGVQGKKIGFDGDFSVGEMVIAKQIFPGFQFVNIGDVALDMRIMKTPEELALCRRAYTYFDRAHAYARDYMLTYGRGTTDYEVGAATTLWIMDTLLSELDLANNASHHGVGADIGVQVRVGPMTSYPHPNQPIYHKIERGLAFQIEGDSYIGGHGGENYRAGIIANEGGGFDPHMVKLWEVSQHTCDMQVQMQKEGVTCSSIAYAIHKYQIDQGCADYIYHRPAHGEGSEGHQPPYMALGDTTVLKRGMCFSEEPGLYDPEHGYGFNWSDHVVTAAKSGYRMSRVPYSKDWCFLKI